MRVTALTSKPVHQVRYSKAGKRGKTESAILPVLVGEAEGLPDELQALVLTSDLQGVASSWRDGRADVLLGVLVVDELLELAARGVLPGPERTGVVLAGDLYSAPGADVRGASGDVREVWTAFAAMHRWVVGVKGNHDRFGTDRERARFEGTEGVHLLDGAVAQLGALSVGGVGEIIGDPDKPGRKSESAFLASLRGTVEREPALMVLHQGPSGGPEQRGSDEVRDAVRPLGGLVVCGHVHWDAPLHTPAVGPQVLNVDGRVVVLGRAPGSATRSLDEA